MAGVSNKVTSLFLQSSHVKCVKIKSEGLKIEIELSKCSGY